MYFLSKSPGSHAISFQTEPWVAFGLPYLLIELFYIGMPVVQMDAQAAQTQYVSLNEYINIHMDKLLRWVVETPMD